jgi:SUN family beta-glucosidase
MKHAILNLAFAASLAVAQPHNHGHGHFHQKKGSPVEKRVDVVTTVEAATATAYILGGKEVSVDEAEAGIANGLYIVVGETTPTYTPVVSSSTAKVEAQFYEQSTKKSSTSTTSVPATTSTTTPAPSTTSTSTSAAAATTSKASSSSSGATGVDAEFPSGELDCSVFPSDYGAVAVDYLGTAGWSSIQQVPDYTFGIDSVISYIVAGVSGDSCTSGSFCSYACPDGYVKSQWPSAQGSTGQSIGGLYCNSDNKLELTRSGYTTLCQKGCGGVSIVNKLNSGAAVCRTDYPGSEAMVLPLWTEAGSTYDLTNIASSEYYKWKGSSTTLQYYVNPKGVAVDDACVWTSSTNPTSAGNWAPINVGVGKSDDGITYLSIFNNSPTSTATLDFDVVISGDISGTCYYKSGSYPDGSTGCTVSFNPSSPSAENPS